MLNIALVSTWHVHTQGYAAFVQQQPDAKLTCVWDDRPGEAEKVAEKFGIDVEPTLDSLLARKDVDAVLIDAPTSEHAEIMIKCAQAKKHIFTEKALALTVADCDRVAAAVRENGVKFAISFPWRGFRWVQYMKKALDEGLVGRPTYLRIRDAHGGSCQNWLPEYWYDEEKAGGGAMMDLGCHPNYLASYFLGKPRRVNSMFNTLCCPAPLEDNAVSVIEFENGVIAVVETGFVTPWADSAFELQGTEGSVFCTMDNKVRVHSKKLGIDGWVTPDALPQELPHPIRQFLDGVLYDQPIPCSLDEGRALTELLEKEYIAHKTGATVEF